MARLTIQQGARSALNRLASVDDDAYQEILMIIKSVAQDVFQPDQLIEAAKSLKHSTAAEGETLIRALISLHVTHAGASNEIGEFVDDVLATVQPGELGDQLRNRLTEVLAVPNISVASKALTVLTEHHKVFKNARVLTDIRPVFSSTKDECTLQAAVLMHNLKISFEEDNQNKEIFIGLDEADLDAIISVLNRAKNKSASLKQFLSETKLPVVEIKS